MHRSEDPMGSRVLSSSAVLSLFAVVLLSIGLVFPALHDIPVVNTCCGDFHRLLNVSKHKPASRSWEHVLTVICSRRKSRSSSQFAKLCFAASSLDPSSSSASLRGYASITFAWTFVSTPSRLDQ